MYDLAVEQTIAAGHQLREYSGKCERCHGHNWLIRLEVCTPVLDGIGLGVDFGILKAILGEVLADYDHVMLNDLPDFTKQNPTSENLARVIYEKCREQVLARSLPVSLKSVTVWESPQSYARYYE